MSATELRAGSTASMLRSPRFYFLAIVIFLAIAFFLPRNPIQTIRGHLEDGTPSVIASVTPPKGTAPLGSSADVKNSTLGVRIAPPPLFWFTGCVADRLRLSTVRKGLRHQPA